MVVLDTVVEPDFTINPEPKTGAEAIWNLLVDPSPMKVSTKVRPMSPISERSRSESVDNDATSLLRS